MVAARLSPRRAPAHAAASPARGRHLLTLTRSRWFTVTANVLAVIALVLLLFAGYLFGLSRLLESRSQRLLADDLAKGAGQSAFAGRLPADGQPVASITIPSIGVHSLVVEGTSASDLEKGPGLLPGSAPPGTGGDSVIEGRRNSFGAPFAGLPQIHVGDQVQVVDALGSFTFAVNGIQVLPAGAKDPIGPAPQGELTLVTSSPSLLPTRALVVSATLAGSPIASVSAAPPPDVTLGLSGDPNAALGAVLGLQGLIALGLGLYAWRRRIADRSLPVMAWVLATPIAAALLLITFSATAKLLPATF